MFIYEYYLCQLNLPIVICRFYSVLINVFTDLDLFAKMSPCLRQYIKLQPQKNFAPKSVYVGGMYFRMFEEDGVYTMRFASKREA